MNLRAAIALAFALIVAPETFAATTNDPQGRPTREDRTSAIARLDADANQPVVVLPQILLEFAIPDQVVVEGQCDRSTHVVVRSPNRATRDGSLKLVRV